MKSPIVIVAAVIAIAALIFLASRSQRTLERGLPARTECTTAAVAWEKALAYIVDHGGSLMQISGTGSMAPYIPAAAPGKDPHTTIVALVATVPGATFADVRPGVPCVYRPQWAAGGRIIHGAAELDGLGWTMSGLHNARSESWERMTADNFEALAAHVFTWPQ